MGPPGDLWNLSISTRRNINDAPTADFHQSMDQMESGGREY
jgi:hypothetical protein